MPASYRIYPDLGLVHVRYEGFALLSEGSEAVARYMRDPDRRAGQKQLVDLSRVTGFERDYARLFALQAEKAAAFLGGPETLIVYYAPSEITRGMARLIVRSWEDVGGVVPLVQDNEAEALALLGLAGTSLRDLESRAG